jgi:hypothetical protein
LYYVLKKFESHNKVISKLDSISKMLTILKIDQQTIKNTISSGFSDFEDCIQYNFALDYKNIDVLITRNTRDYKDSEIPVMIPADYLKTVTS